jgi:hypothetical protein
VTFIWRAIQLSIKIDVLPTKPINIGRQLLRLSAAAAAASSNKLLHDPQ